MVGSERKKKQKYFFINRRKLRNFELLKSEEIGTQSLTKLIFQANDNEDTGYTELTVEYIYLIFLNPVLLTIYTYSVLMYFLTLLTDPRTKDYFLVENPLNIIFIVMAYIYFVKKLGPQVMENRKPFKLQKLLMMYNLLQIIVNFYIFWEVRYILFKHKIILRKYAIKIN